MGLGARGAGLGFGETVRAGEGLTGRADVGVVGVPKAGEGGTLMAGNDSNFLQCALTLNADT